MDEEESIPDDILESFEDELIPCDDTPASWHDKWTRATPCLSPTSPVAFMWTSIDMTTGPPLPGAPGSRSKPVPIVRLYGVTQQGHSVCAHCYGFTPYCYAELPYTFDDADKAKLEAELNAQLTAKASRSNNNDVGPRCVLGIDILHGWRSLMGYDDGSRRHKLAKIYVSVPTLVPTLRRLLIDGIRIPGSSAGYPIGLQPYESNVPFLLRFLIDAEITGCQWLEVSKFQLRTLTKQSRCQIEFDCIYEHIVAHEPVGDWLKIAPLRVLATDIECQGRKGHFPSAEHDPVIQISCVVHVHGRDEPLVQAVFTLNTCSAITGAEVICARTEDELLRNWAAFVRACDPDVITGYNTQNFDIPYLLNRAKKRQLKGFADFGRICGVPARMRDTTFASNQYGKRENIDTTVPGRVMFDLLPYMIRNHRLSSYSLNSVCAEFLGQQKEDVHHSIIAELHLGTDEDRRRLAVYCLKDSQLVIRLMTKLCVLINYIEMSRVTGVSLDFLIKRGQQIKVFSMLLRRCRQNKLAIPQMPKSADSGAKFEGATVIEPHKAFYREPIATLDFASLYPSIMQAYNLCYSTMLTKEQTLSMAQDEYRVSPECADGRYYFATKKRGLLPQILEDLLRARKQAKKDMKAATDPMVKAVQNGRQLALKVSANSVYGFTGAANGQMPCLQIASAVTAFGRELLLKTRTFVEQKYTVANGFAADAKVIYGDTDSVMVKFGLKSIADTMPVAEQVAKEVSEIFPSPVKLEFEKVYYPYLLMNKKRYAGLLWTRPQAADYLDAKGLETVRRDNCLLVRQLVDACLRKMIVDQNVQAALDHAKHIIGELLQNRIDISLLVITKSLSKDADSKEYKGKQAHVELARKMRQRDPGTAPSVGDRVPFVIVPGPKGAAAFEKAEDPVFVLENNMPIDAQYYLENQLYKPLHRIFEPVVKDTETLLKGDHTRVVCKPTPVARKGGIVMFASKSLRCLGCKIVISSGTVCQHCKPREHAVYMKRLKDVNEHEKAFNKLWTQCQRCQGSLHQDVLCTNSDCPIFYKRKKVQADLKDAQATLARFDW